MLQPQFNITPNVTLPLVRRFSCRVLIGQKAATSDPVGYRTAFLQPAVG